MQYLKVILYICDLLYLACHILHDLLYSFYLQVIRHYHGHLSACYGLALHPTIDVLVTCGRDSTARVWDMRTKANIHTLSGHTNTVASVICQAAEPQVCGNIVLKCLLCIRL